MQQKRVYRDTLFSKDCPNNAIVWDHAVLPISILENKNRSLVNLDGQICAICSCGMVYVSLLSS